MTVLVGPNEAGKTSVLKLLASLSPENHKWSGDDRHHYPKEAEINAEFTFDLSDEDREAIGSNLPRQYVVTKDDQGTRRHNLIPRLERPKEHREAFKKKLIAVAHNKTFAEAYGSGELEYNELVNLCENLDIDVETYQADTLISLEKIQETLKGVSEKFSLKNLQIFSSEIAKFIALERRDDPNKKAKQITAKRRPRIIEFTARDRELDPTYDLNNFPLIGPSRALQNLCNISGLDLEALKADFDSGRTERIQTQFHRANGELKKIFSGSWSQSDVFLQLAWQRPLIEIMTLTEEDEEPQFGPIRERSDGLRQYAALLAFIIKENVHSPILLIDEAEQHLHYDAQADLIQTFTERKLASQVIYTTHSAGCLPEDLGVGVKLVRPVNDSADFSTSEIKNNFWSSDTSDRSKGTLGFSPLLYGMGAETLAFFPSRKALVVEGPTEMLLIPTIFRQVNDVDYNGFQVVPGLATTSKSFLKQLSAQGENVAYLVDQDQAGRGYKKALIKDAGVDSSKIFFVSESESTAVTVEDWIDDEVFEESLKKYLFRHYGQLPEIASSKFVKIGKANMLKSLEKDGYNVSKPELAYIVLEHVETANDPRIYNLRHKENLLKLSEHILNSFQA